MLAVLRACDLTRGSADLIVPVISVSAGSVQIKLADHPPFSLPEGDVCAIDLREDVSDSNLLEHLTTITSTFGLSEGKLSK